MFANRRTRAVALAFTLAALCPLLSSAQAKSPLESATYRLPLWSQQISIREGWLAKHHALLLDMMRRSGVDMWIVVNEEFHNDPLTEYVAPPRPYTGNRDIFVFLDTGTSLRKVAITGYSEDNLKRFFENPDDPIPAEKLLPQLYAQYKPKHIAIAMDAKRGVQRSITHDSYKFLATAMGPEAESHFVPAADLIEAYCATRIPEEFDTYKLLVGLTEELTKRAFSNEVITPGKTTVGDVRRWLYDAMYANHVTTWFQQDIRLQRKGRDQGTSRGFLGVEPETTVIEPGDLLHLDFGVTGMGLNTDWQKMAYVLLPGEKDVPAGMKVAFAHTSTLQHTLEQSSRPGRKAGDVYADIMAQMAKDGIEAKVYSHPIGDQGHGLGAALDYRSSEAGAAHDKLQQEGTYLSIELNTATPLPEWNNQKVYMMNEDDAYLTKDGYKTFFPLQDKIYLIRSK